MICDYYYIAKVLRIYYSDEKENGSYGDIELEKERCSTKWIHDLYDEDSDDYEEKIKRSIQDILLFTMKPILVYMDGDFLKPILETKYKNTLEEKVELDGKKWSDIKKVVKMEMRYTESQ
jgi:hypothetical protein